MKLAGALGVGIEEFTRTSAKAKGRTAGKPRRKGRSVRDA
jgi:hypothetical protein